MKRVARRALAAATVALLAGCAGGSTVSMSGLGVRIGSEAGANCMPRSAAQNAVEGLQCLQRADDAGTACTADSQCEGTCEMDDDTAAGMPASGHCSATVQAKPGGR